MKKNTVARKNQESVEQLIQSIVFGISELKGEEIVVLDLRDIPNAAADYFVICHGNSTTQAEAISRSVEKATLTQLNEHPWHIEGQRNAQWILMDYINIVVHVFEKEARKYYGLEELWADAKTLKIEARA